MAKLYNLGEFGVDDGDVIGSNTRADLMTWDAFEFNGTQQLTLLDGGAGGKGGDAVDELHIKLTSTQLTALMQELATDFGVAHAGVNPQGMLTGIGNLFNDNKGTFQLDSIGARIANWEKVFVEVVPDPKPAPHAGDQIAKWDFEDSPAWPEHNVQEPTGWINVSNYAEANNLGTYAKTMEVVGGPSALQGFGAGESQWLDTAASPGNIWIQLAEANRTTNITHDAQLTVSVAKQMFGDGTGGSNGGADSHTDPNAFVEFYFNYEKVGTVHASDLTDVNTFHDFHFMVHADNGLDPNQLTDQLFIKSGGTEQTAQGLAIDHVLLHDWIA